MNEELNRKLEILLKSIGDSLNDIRKNGRKARDLKNAVRNSRNIVTQVLEQQLGASLEEQICVSELPDEDWLYTVRHIIDVLNDPFYPINSYETYFLQLFNYLTTTSKDKLISNMMFSFNKLRDENEQNYSGFCAYLQQHPLWGTFDPDNGDMNSFELRADVLKRHAYDFLWLYRRLNDYLSKRTLAAILMNWADLQCDALVVVKSIFRDYWEPDIFPDNKDDVFVDIGAYTGDSIGNYLDVYGKGYKKIYAYEISESSCKILNDNITQDKLPNIEIRRKGAGSRKTFMYVKDSDADLSANSLEATGDIEHRVEVVRIDDDVEETPTLIKMDIEGAEKDALLGCEKTIRNHRPKLAICTYHGYDDIWKIPSMIYEMNPDYQFYMRHYGGNWPPTEFVLLCR